MQVTNGKPAAVLVSVADDDELESILLACSPPEVEKPTSYHCDDVNR